MQTIEVSDAEWIFVRECLDIPIHELSPVEARAILWHSGEFLISQCSPAEIETFRGILEKEPLSNEMLARARGLNLTLRSHATDPEKAADRIAAEAPSDGLPRFWRLFSYLLSRKSREELFEPAYNDMLQDYLETRGQYRTKWAKRWLKLVFTLKTVSMVCGCMRAALVEKGKNAILCLLPGPFRQWLARWF